MISINLSIELTGADREQFPRAVAFGVPDSDGLAKAGTMGRGKPVGTQVPDIPGPAELTMARTQEVPSDDCPPRCYFAQVWAFPRPIVLV